MCSYVECSLMQSTHIRIGGCLPADSNVTFAADLCGMIKEGDVLISVNGSVPVRINAFIAPSFFIPPHFDTCAPNARRLPSLGVLAFQV
jgi:hypothetical protein